MSIFYCTRVRVYQNFQNETKTKGGRKNKREERQKRKRKRKEKQNKRRSDGAIRSELSVLRSQVRLEVILSVKSMSAVRMRTFVGVGIDMNRFDVSPQGEGTREPVAISAAKPTTVIGTAWLRSCIMSMIEPTDP